MTTVRPKKKKPEEIQQEPLRELPLTPEDWQAFEHGVTLFNSGKFWHAHEAWELIWLRHAEDERLFFQGLIQLAAAYHQLVVKRNYRAMCNNLDKAVEKLTVFQPEYCGICVTEVLGAIDGTRGEADRVDGSRGAEFDFALIPKLQFHKPGNPDLLVEIRDILRDERFFEGVKLFNGGYYWEAHEAWEDIWRGREGDAKSFLQAFVEGAAGCNFLKQAKRSSALYLLGKSVEKFRQFETIQVGFPLRAFVEQLASLLALLQSGAEPRAGNGKSIALPKIPFVHHRDAPGS